MKHFVAMVALIVLLVLCVFLPFLPGRHDSLAVPVSSMAQVVGFAEHALPSHDSDVLRWTPEELAARPGHYALQDASSPHWKYFWFD